MKYFAVLLLFISYQLKAQEHAWIFFKDKPQAKYYLQNPLQMLSQKALDRRTEQQIALDLSDVPVALNYLQTLKRETELQVYGASKWRNAVHVVGTEEQVLKTLSLPFVARVQFANRSLERTNLSIDIPESTDAQQIQQADSTAKFYGNTTSQNSILHLDELHKKGYLGAGIDIAVFDEGFYGVRKVSVFSHLLDGNLENGEIKNTYNFVNQTTDVYQEIGRTHGLHVLSTLAAYKKDFLIGTAPNANYHLFVTEDYQGLDHPLEEFYWVQAAEKADSLGVSIINSSLGYTQFAEAKYNYTYADLNGTTAFVTIGAAIAASKGILVVNAVGNLGNKSWKYLAAPADAPNILAVGAVDVHKQIASFSSYGPTADERVKPETLAQGVAVKVVNTDNQIVEQSGTSFSCPIIAGIAACLWQAFSFKTNLEIREMIIQNSQWVHQPRAQEGYGVLDLKGITIPEKKQFPFQFFWSLQQVEVLFDVDFKGFVWVDVFSITGKKLIHWKCSPDQNIQSFKQLASGIYVVKYRYQQQTEIRRIQVGN
ncbi:S8 family peptidase [Ochrovirga pacifica]|uniref:S8 family peptidase n=1 Tax=Ochrovirga pacifica TaxID=1042376 RepID=UPI0002558E7D|nr:S8 family serine peptidase [Ochrovirga pacifica]